MKCGDGLSLSSMWKSSDGDGIDAYVMNDSRSLFEFLSRKEAEHFINGEWRGKKSKLSLEWWSPQLDAGRKR